MINKSEVKVCKKCKRILPADYKYRYCEACRNRQVDVIKKGIAVTAMVVTAVVPLVTKGKFTIKPNSKD